MGMEDREWFQEGRAERERLIAADRDRTRKAEQARSPLVDLIADHERKRRGGSALVTGAKMGGLLVLLCLAVFGALALVQHFAA